MALQLNIPAGAPQMTQEALDKMIATIIKQKTTGTIRPKAQTAALNSLKKTYKAEFDKATEVEQAKLAKAGSKLKEVTIKAQVPEAWNQDKANEVMTSAVKARTSGTYKPKAQQQALTSLKAAHKPEFDKMVEENVAKLTKEMPK